jgi:hypothetical protein
MDPFEGFVAKDPSVWGQRGSCGDQSQFNGVLVKGGLQQAASPGQAGPNGSNGHVQRVRHFLVGKTFQVEENDGGSIIFRQQVEGFTKILVG